MLRADGKPRYWLDDEDPWRLLLIPLFLALMGAAWLMPGRRPIPAAPVVLPANREPAPGPSPRVMMPPSMEHPYEGQLLWPSRLPDAEGRAEAGSVVTFYLGDRSIGVTRADAAGRWRFQLVGFPPGTHRVRVESGDGGVTRSSQSVTITVARERSGVERSKKPAGRRLPGR